MTAKYRLTLAVALCGAVAVTTAEAATKKRAKIIAPVARGCTSAIPPFCIGVTSGGKTYAMFGQTPFIPSGIGVDVWGAVSPGPCGPTIQVTSWRPNKLRCAPR
jgi:hypothetical protein